MTAPGDDEAAVRRYVENMAREQGIELDDIHPDALLLLERFARNQIQLQSQPLEWKANASIAFLTVGFIKATVRYVRRQIDDTPTGWCWRITRDGVLLAVGEGLESEDAARHEAELAILRLNGGSAQEDNT